MNARTQIKPNNSQNEFIKKINFQPVFDENGEIFDVRELEIPTDRRNGIAAMRELAESFEQGDHVIGQDGWTGKQRRVLSTPAPLQAHYFRYSQKWDARTGVMKDAAVIQLPFEVVWTLFEMLFEGQYSFEVIDIFNEDEEVVPVGVDHQGEQADDAPGRRLFSRATVALKLHLPGQPEPRVYHGVGVSYGHLKTEKTGNIYAINSERRTCDKGAIADAKREALSGIGRVFRRAFEDGDEMERVVEKLLLARVQDMNRPAIHQRSRNTEEVPAPVRKSPPVKAKEEVKASQKAEAQTDSLKEDKAKAEPAKPSTSTKVKAAPTKGRNAQAPKASDKVKIVVPEGPARSISKEGFTEALIDILFETCVTGTEAQNLISKNEDVINQYAEDRAEIDDVVKSMAEQPEDEIPDFSESTQPTEEEATEISEEDLRIEVAGKSGKDVLSELQQACESVKTVAEINAIIAANPAALRKLTPKQMKRFTEARSELEVKLKG